MSWGTTRPAPRFRWPTSLLPIWPSGRPTARPDASSSVRGARSHSRCQAGVCAQLDGVAFAAGAESPAVEDDQRDRGARPRLLFILKGMQSIRAFASYQLSSCLRRSARSPRRRGPCRDRGRVVLSGAAGETARAARGRRRGRCRAAQQGDWRQVTLDGWIFKTSLGPDQRERIRSRRDQGAVGEPSRDSRRATSSRISEGVRRSTRWASRTAGCTCGGRAGCALPPLEPGPRPRAPAPPSRSGASPAGAPVAARSRHRFAPRSTRAAPSRRAHHRCSARPTAPRTGRGSGAPLRCSGAPANGRRVQLEGWVKTGGPAVGAAPVCYRA